MKKVKFSLRTKAEVILTVCLFVGIGISSVWGTVTMTDTTTTTDDSDLIINYPDAFINVWNATIDNNSIDNTVISVWEGDPIFNDSIAKTLLQPWLDRWNSSVSNPFNQDLNDTDAFVSTGLKVTGTVDRWINDSSDNLDTLIHNSNGNCWEPSEANLILAIDNCDIGDSVWVGSGFELSTGFTVPTGVSVDCQNNIFTVASDFGNIITIEPDSKLYNCHIDLGAVAFTHACIYIPGSTYYKIFDNNTVLKNIELRRNYATPHSGRGVEFVTFDSPNERATRVIIDGLKTCYFEHAVLMNTTGSTNTNYINGNRINNFWDSNSTYSIYLNESGTAGNIDGNAFSNCGIQTKDVDTIEAIHVSGRNNDFSGIFIWDLQVGQTSVNLTADSEDCKIEGQLLFDTYGADHGTNNIIVDTINSRVQYDTIKPFKENTDLDIGSSGTGDLNLNREGLSSQDIKLFQSVANGQLPAFYIYGNDGTSKYAKFQISGIGTFEFTQSSGESMTFSSGKGLSMQAIVDAGGDITMYADDDITITPDFDGNNNGYLQLGNPVMPTSLPTNDLQSGQFHFNATTGEFAIYDGTNHIWFAPK